MGVTETLESKLRTAFDPEAFELIDESHHHAGHAGWREEGESHFRLVMTSAAFAGQSRVARQRAVNRVLSEELLGERIHALAMSLKAPGE
ncbi:MAG: BolA family protein [Pseudomonadota bacterium]